MRTETREQTTIELTEGDLLSLLVSGGVESRDGTVVVEMKNELARVEAIRKFGEHYIDEEDNRKI